MSNAQAERAISQLYESDSLRSELRDEEASLLLMWGEARLSELAKHDLPDSQFDHLSQKFRSLLAAINVCVGKRKTTPSQHLPMMANISSAAEAAGLMLMPDDQTTFLKQQSALTNQDAISELLGLLKPFDGPMPSASNTSQATAESVAPAPAAVEGNRPAQPEDLPRPEPMQTVVEAAPSVTPQPVPDNHTQPPQPEELPASQNMGEAPAGIAISEPAPPIVDNSQPTQPEDLPRPEPASENVVEAAAQSLAPQPPQPEVAPESQPPSQGIAEAAEIITPQPPPANVDHTQPPQPEDLPEFPQPSPPQEGTHDV